MNSFFDSNDFKTNTLNRQEYLRLPSVNCNFQFSNNDTSTDQTSSSQTLNYTSQFSNCYLPNNNENLIGIFGQTDSSKYSFRHPNYAHNQNFNDPNQNSYNSNCFNSYMNNVSMLQNETTSNENLIRFNLLQQFDPNFKQYSNLFPLNSQQLESKPQEFNNQLGLQISTNQSQSDFNVTEIHMNEQKPRKPKKSRILFSQWQINELEKLFKKQKYVTSNERELMAKRLKLQANQVKIWFQNRRYKIKKQNEAQKD